MDTTLGETGSLPQKYKLHLYKRKSQGMYGVSHHSGLAVGLETK